MTRDQRTPMLILATTALVTLALVAAPELALLSFAGLLAGVLARLVVYAPRRRRRQ